jgi:hypothetical protein
LHEGRIVCPLAKGRELLLAVSALSTCDLETDDYSVSLLELCDVLANAVHFSAEFLNEKYGIEKLFDFLED